jgi:glutathione S-transferase
MNRAMDVTSSVLASTLRRWRGTTASKKVAMPEQRPVLFDREGDAECRLVREALTELNLDADIYPVPEGGDRYVAKLKQLSGNDTIPFLFDPNTGGKHSGADAIITYLFRRYAQSEAPSALKAGMVNLLTSRLATEVRRSAGVSAIPSRHAEQIITLYSFESSPYSRLVREKLCELQIAYTLINLGKQQRADMGPANARLTLKPYKPLPNTKRDEFFRAHGNVQVPYVVDPNSGSNLFESADIVNYLMTEYAL